MFENKSQSPEETTLRAILALKEWENAQPPRINTNKPSLRPPHQHLHRSSEDSPLNNQEIYCNTDAAWISTSRTAGLAWIFLDRNQMELDRRSKVQTAVTSPCMGEALAIREALLHAASQNYSTICIRSDSQVLVQAISSLRHTTELYRVLSDIDAIYFSASSPFDCCRFFFTPRANNGLADGLAKACLSSHIALG